MTARLRTTPEDFRVDEVPLYAPTGEGNHTFVRIEKRLRTTEEVARDLARAAGVSARDVGYAGRKDRRAVATQWFSVPVLDPERALALALRGARVLEAARHPHKLRTGQLRANRFDLVVRDVDAAACAAAETRLAEAIARGFPNRFGGQRFGRDGRNVEHAQRMLRGESVPGGRRAARFLLSALQASVFNAVLAARSAPPHRLERGDVAVRHDSGGLFLVEDEVLEAPRAEAFEISPTGPIFGTRSLEPAGAVAERERAVLAQHGVDLARLFPPRGIRLRGGRRALRARPEDALLTRGADHVRLCFTLPSGSYATVLIEELLGADLAEGFE
ncbi:MAG: tRNA pseudouridine(13) synthase TruD [Myxococcales bacterium]|nr:tRNA pseudouridine(13) synthase TruD [Myxococcales bacterium]MDH5305571.1 tRNA pseudouridine(13) synthase TruD [Myxococcales bacterium]